MRKPGTFVCYYCGLFDAGSGDRSLGYCAPQEPKSDVNGVMPVRKMKLFDPNALDAHFVYREVIGQASFLSKRKVVGLDTPFYLAAKSSGT